MSEMTQFGSYIRQSHDFTDPFHTFVEDAAEAHQIYVGGTAGGTAEFRDSCIFQLEFLKTRGLQRDTKLLDVGCGSLRAGMHFISYLDAGCYFGIDISRVAMERGLERELGVDVARAKRPVLVLSDSFEFGLFDDYPSMAIANSVFTHLTEPESYRCLSELAAFLGDRSLDFYATFTEALGTSKRPAVGHYLGGRGECSYTREEFRRIGADCGWQCEYIGSWGHPKNSVEPPESPIRRQMMMHFRR